MEHIGASDTSDGKPVDFLTICRDELKLQTENGREIAVIMNHPSKSTQKVNDMFRTFLNLPRFWRNIPLGPTESLSTFESS